MNNPYISVIVPVYGCKNTVKALCEGASSALNTTNYSYEILLIDDSSNDGTWEIIEQISFKYAHIRGVLLSRNFGQHSAITAGLAESRGSFAIIMDCDLQDPPELIPELLDEIHKGYDIIFTRRIEKQHTHIRRLLSAAYFKAISIFNSKTVDRAEGNFSCISRKVINSYLEIKDKDRHYLMILRWLGYRVSHIDYEHKTRHDGKSSYSFSALLAHAVNGLFFQTSKLLHFIIITGFCIVFAGLISTGVLIYRYFRYDALQGWTSLAVLQLLIGGFIILSTGIAAVYIGKVFDQVKDRPLYIIEKRTYK